MQQYSRRPPPGTCRSSLAGGTQTHLQTLAATHLQPMLGVLALAGNLCAFHAIRKFAAGCVSGSKIGAWSCRLSNLYHSQKLGGVALRVLTYLLFI